MKSFQSKFGLLVLVVLTAVFSATAQTSKGTLVGVARDKTGAVIPGASVTIRDEATGDVRGVTASSVGAYRFDAIDPGPYTIDVTSPGFQKFEVNGVRVQSTIVTSYDVTIQVGNPNDVVNVAADNATINTENGQLAGVINAAEIDKLPIFTLNPAELAFTVPGVQPVTQVGQGANFIDLQVNGARPQANNFLLDGQEINDVQILGMSFQPQIPDSFDSETVITNSANAEYGRAGGGILNLVTKSGTNAYHGTIFERYQGSGLASTPGNLRGSDYDKPRQNTHSYGFTAGGPIFKDKLFVFGGLQLQRTYGQEQPGTNLLPDAAGYATLQSITGPAAAQVQLLDQYLSGGSYLTEDRIYPTSTTKNVGALPGCPASGCVITFAGFQRPDEAINSPDTQWLYRVDYHPWEKDSFGFRYLHDRSSLSPDFQNSPLALQGFDTEVGGPSELGEGFWTHIFTPHLLNEFRASEARVNASFAPTAQTAANPLNSQATLTFGDITGTALSGSIAFPSLGPDQNFPQGRDFDLYQFQDTVSWTHGKHTVRGGVDIGRIIEIELVSQNALGELDFTSGGSGQSSLGNFLLNQLGPSGEATKTFGPTRLDAHGFRNGVFIQDDIKFSADLTVNIGLRWDFLTNPENNLKYPGLDPNNPFAPIDSVFRVNEDYNNFSPRIGFAYSPHGMFGFLGDGKTVLRGGFGIFYDSTFSGLSTNAAQSAPNAPSGLLTSVGGDGLANATSLIPTIPPDLTPQSLVLTVATNFANPVTYQYNLGIERELPGQIVLAARYVGNTAHKLFASQQYNYFDGLTGDRLNPDRGYIGARGNFAGANYNGAEISASHNFKHGIDVRANYVYSKSLSDGDDVGPISTPSSFGANLAVGGRSQEYGNSSFDHRQFFSVAYVWSPKGLTASNAFANAALGALTRHWTFSGVTQLQSGQYNSLAVNGIDTNNDSSAANDRPVVSNPSAPLKAIGVDGIYVGGTPGLYYDTIAENTSGPGDVIPAQPASAFHFLIVNDPGNLLLHKEIGRNSFMNPGTTRNDMALEKGIGLSYLHFNRGTFIVRAEAQNVFNHNDNQIGDTNVLDDGAGFLDTSRAATNRVVILWGKIQF